MLKNFSYSIQVRYVEGKGFFLMPFSSQHTKIIIQNVINQLFSWDSFSYYGANIEKGVYDTEHCIVLTPLQALYFFASYREQSLFPVTWDDYGKDCLRFAKDSIQSFEAGHISPSFPDWKNGKYVWEIETDSSFHSLFKEWTQEAVTEKLQTLHEHDSPAWQQIHHLFQHREGTVLLAQRSFSKEEWLNRIGWSLTTAENASLALRIEEPKEDGAPWTVQLLAQTQRNEEGIVIKNIYKLPKKFADYQDAFLQTLHYWNEEVPLFLNEEGRFHSEWSDDEAWSFLATGSEILLHYGVSVYLPSWWSSLKKEKVKLGATVKNTPIGSGLLGMNQIADFDWKISINNHTFSYEEFQKLLQEQRRFIHINGEWLRLDPTLIQRVKKFMDKAEKQGISVHDVIQQHLSGGSAQRDTNAVDWDEVKLSDLKDIVEIDTTENVAHWIKGLTQLQNMQKLQPILDSDMVPRHYQITGFSWLVHLLQYGFGALLADDMGLGKSFQTIMYLQYAIQHKQLQTPSLIIAPTSVVGNWEKEFKKFAPSLRIATHYGSNRTKGMESFQQFVSQYDIIITSYPLAHLDSEELQNISWGSVILDEAQNIKNANTKQARAIKKLPSQHRVALTGTPVENRLSELWSIFDFLNRGYLGSSKSFSDRFVQAIEREGDKETAMRLQKMLSPFILRRSKTDQDVGLDLPEKQEQKEFVPLSTEQASLYETLVSEMLEKLSGLSGIERRGFILFMLGKLKQICDHPALYLKEESYSSAYIERSIKMEKLVELLDAIFEKNEQVLLFTQYIRMGTIIQQMIQQRYGESALFLNGSVKRIEREEMIEAFQDGQHPCLILSIKAGGTGLNLTAANHVIHFDRWWNPAVENQATDRAYRIGQTRFVHVHKLITIGTLEEKIDEMLEKKQALSQSIITSENWITELSNDEIRDLLIHS